MHVAHDGGRHPADQDGRHARPGDHAGMSGGVSNARGWWHGASERERGYAAAYLGSDDAPVGEHNVHWAMIRSCWSSVARIAICQMQDVLGLDASARMNIPGQMGHWTWRFQWSQVGPQPAERLARLSAAYGRASIDRLALAAYPAGQAMP